MVTLKGFLQKIIHRRAAESAEFTFLLFSFERKENNNRQPYGEINILAGRKL